MLRISQTPVEHIHRLLRQPDITDISRQYLISDTWNSGVPPASKFNCEERLSQNTKSKTQSKSVISA